jgi:hypothetical protein
MALKNALAYSTSTLITAVKCFIAEAQGDTSLGKATLSMF